MSQVPPPPAPPPPPPPPPPGSGPGPAGSAASFSVGDAISYGWNAYWKNIGPLLIITIVIIVIQAILNGIGQVSGNIGVRLLFSILGWVVSMILSMGLIRASLA